MLDKRKVVSSKLTSSNNFIGHSQTVKALVFDINI